MFIFLYHTNNKTEKVLSYLLKFKLTKLVLVLRLFVIFRAIKAPKQLLIIGIPISFVFKFRVSRSQFNNFLEEMRIIDLFFIMI